MASWSRKQVRSSAIVGAALVVIVVSAIRRDLAALALGAGLLGAPAVADSEEPTKENNDAAG